MSTININGRIITGNNISVSGSTVIVDGKTMDLNNIPEKEINITVSGSIQTLEISGTVDVKITDGNVNDLVNSGNMQLSCDSVTDSIINNGIISRF